ncbi:diguanylate cyclase [Cognatiluteimonas weifangensis]|uniref:diguanylate cyclase n=1 Tax=Cognatiluteimonas weifangensis TaxID=2303539 RepID=UPI001314DBCC|nr:diguanylate cyclase [Luteimonas weifangensis]
MHALPGDIRARARTWVWLLLLALALAASPLPGTAADLPLQGGWRAAVAGEQAGDVTRADPQLRHFDPVRLQTFAAGEAGSWVLLWPAQGDWPAPPFVLQARGAGLQTLRFHPPGGPARSARATRVDPRAWPGHGRLVFPVAVAPAPGQPLRLHVDSRGVIAAPMTFAVLPPAAYLRADARWLAFASACLAIMAAMGLMALFFALRLRDPTFVHYAAFVLAYALILGLQTGYLFEPLGWQWLAGPLRGVARVATAASVLFAILFADRFANLRRYLPRGRRLLLGYAALIVAVGATGLLPGLGALARVLTNPLLVLGGPLLLAASALAAWRGSRYARFFLLGWTPLLAVTVAGSLQPYGMLPAWTWIGDAALAAGAFEALVLSLGLADRTLALRRDRDQARRLADLDPLTGLYNRRAWSERLLALETAMRRQGRPLSLLFLDLDRFKQLNDRLGHEAGDAALRATAGIMRGELREQDEVGRYGGEEFVVALPDADGAHALQAAERIRRRLQQRAGEDVGGATPTASIGVAMLQPGEDLASLIARADAAMYAAKAAGRNRVVLHPG